MQKYSRSLGDEISFWNKNNCNVNIQLIAVSFLMHAAKFRFI